MAIGLYVFVSILLIASIPVGSVGLNNMEEYPALPLKALMLGLTPVTALPALMAYGAREK